MDIPTHGFKEWSLVCAALAAGHQSLILRKGGIHEGRTGFWWQHPTFYLFPTHFHEQDQHCTWQGSPPPPDPPGHHLITHTATVTTKGILRHWPAAAALAPFHHWSETTIRDRFDYTAHHGISYALLRVYRLSAPWHLPTQPSYGGCRSWLTLPTPPPGLTLHPVLTDSQHHTLTDQLHPLLTET